MNIHHSYKLPYPNPGARCKYGWHCDFHTLKGCDHHFSGCSLDQALDIPVPSRKTKLLALRCLDEGIRHPCRTLSHHPQITGTHPRDIRIAEQQAQMALPEAKVGLLPCAGGTQNLAWLVGEGWAKRMILCGERIGAEKAQQIGLVEEVVATGMALESALALADKVAEQSPSAVTACKTLIQKGRSGTMQSALPLERELFVGLFDTKDQVEGVQAFLEKRKANWVNG